MDLFNKSMVLTFIIAAFITLLSRLKHMIENPDIVARDADGKIKWLYCVFVNTVELVIGGVVGISVGIVLEHYHLLDGNMLMLAVAMSGLAGGKLFEAVQNRIHKKIEESENTDFGF